MERFSYSAKKEKTDGKLKLWKLRLCLVLTIVAAGAGLFGWKNRGDFLSEETLSRPKVEDTRSQEQTQSDFDDFIHQIFVEEVTSDSLTLNYTLYNPKDYGIEDVTPTLGEYSLSHFRDNIMVSENWLASLEHFDYDKLTEEQRLIYDILRQLLKTDLKGSDLIEYSECLGPTTGMQAQLPVLLAEYSFYGQEDVEDYLELLTQIPDYFEQIIAFEQKKSANGLFMSDDTAQAIIEQCQEFITSPEDNYLITTFKSRLNELGDISENDALAYQKQNKKYVLEKVIPAYQKLMDALEEWKGTGNNKGGLCKLKKGKEYYAWRVEVMTGSQKSVEEINRLLDKTIKQEQKKMSKIMTESPDAYYDAQEVTYPCTDPVETVNWLKKQIGGDFLPLPEGISCEVKYVDESLEKSLSPAFYLTSPIDNYTENIVYINQSEEYDLSQAFSTIAHETYPGHLYQNCYFQSLDPNPIRSIVDVGGYIEGWGTYAELYSYQLAGLDENVTQLLQSNTLATLCLYAKADIGVNYLGWSERKLYDYLEEFGFSGSQSKTIYQSMVAEPVSYMQYTLGYLEIIALRNKAEKKLGGTFSLKEFHEFFLSMGASPFVVIEDRLEQWIAAKQK